MIKIDFPQHPFKLKKEKNKEYIFDEVRKKWIVLTPEEWVRQNFIQYLIQTLKIPVSLIAVEKQIQLNDIIKRCDIIVYKNAQPFMIVECKEQTIDISEKTLLQILNYNQKLQVEVLVLTNGNSTFAFNTLTKKYLQKLSVF